MRKNIIVLIIYLVGCVVSYQTFKYTKINVSYYKGWTKGDRVFGLLISTGSWLSVCSIGFINLLELMDNKEPAKW